MKKKTRLFLPLIIVSSMFLCGCEDAEHTHSEPKVSTEQSKDHAGSDDINLPPTENDGETTDTSDEDEETTESLEDDSEDNMINFSDDETANTIIARYNQLNPDKMITGEMVSCPDNSGINLTVIHFKYMDFQIGETDGSPSFKCQSTLEYNPENTDGFFQEAFSMIQAVQESYKDDAIKDILSQLREGEYPISNSISIGDRRFHFCSPASGEITYELKWNWAKLY